MPTDPALRAIKQREARREIEAERAVIATFMSWQRRRYGACGHDARCASECYFCDVRRDLRKFLARRKGKP